MNCFVAGTMVCTIQGSIPIEEIQPGDYVLSTDLETGDTTYKMVLETYENTAEELVHISVGEENFVTTTGHPFYVENRGWTEAGELQTGDKLLLSTGEWVEISNIETEFPEEAVTVYNFAVEDYHTYHVGESGVLVHNACGVKVSSPNGKKGCTAHQEMINSIDDFANGSVHKEVAFKVNNGFKSKRYADAVVRNSKGDITGIYQVGKVNKNGLPVIRESRAIADIKMSSNYNGCPIYFMPYNSNIGPIIY